jgi:hypothetical protein
MPGMTQSLSRTHEHPMGFWAFYRANAQDPEGSQSVYCSLPSAYQVRPTSVSPPAWLRLCPFPIPSHDTQWLSCPCAHQLPHRIPILWFGALLFLLFQNLILQSGYCFCSGIGIPA